MFSTLEEAEAAVLSLDFSQDTEAQKLQKLLNIVSQAPLDTEGTVTYLYSGGTGDGITYSGDVVVDIANKNPSVRIIDNTIAGRLLSGDAFTSKVGEVYGEGLQNIRNPDIPTQAGDWMNHKTDGSWASASRRFVAEAVRSVQIYACSTCH